MEKCFYCKADIERGSVVGMCRRCMHGVWGEKMSNAIVDGMEKEKASGNLELGCVGSSGENICEVSDIGEDVDDVGEEVCEGVETTPEVSEENLDNQVEIAVEELEEMQSIDVIEEVTEALENPPGQPSFIREAIGEIQNRRTSEEEPVLEVLEPKSGFEQPFEEGYNDDGTRFFSD